MNVGTGIPRALVAKLVAPTKRGGVRLSQAEVAVVIDLLRERDEIIEAARRHLRHSDCDGGAAEWCGLADLVKE